jgi:hypothetical protein
MGNRNVKTLVAKLDNAIVRPLRQQLTTASVSSVSEWMGSIPSDPMALFVIIS